MCRWLMPLMLVAAACASCSRKQADTPAACYQRGMAQAQQHRWFDAIDEFTKAIALDGNYAAAYYQRGEAYFAMHMVGKAVNDFTVVIRLNPKCVEAYSEHASASRILRRRTQAIDDYTKVIQLRPDDWAAYSFRGQLLVDEHRYEAAVNDLTKAIQMDPSWGSYEYRAEAYYHLGQLREAWADVLACERLGGALRSGFVRELSRAMPRPNTTTTPTQNSGNSGTP